MNSKAIEYFVCPACGVGLRLNAAPAGAAPVGEIEEGSLDCTQCGANYPIVRSVPRFVTSEDCAASFGFQWNQFPTLQVDRVMGNDLSRHRFYATTGWPTRLKGQRVLEAGCGAGRFTQIVLETGADVFSFDLSNAVEAARVNNDGAPNFHLFQADIYRVPLKKRTFDKVFCMGVLQHCPDVKGAFLSLVPYLREGGEIVIDVYEKRGRVPKLKYWVRPLARRMKPETLHRMLCAAIPFLFNLKKTVNRIPGIGPALAGLIPIGPLSHAPRLNYTEAELKQVKVLSAFDMLSPRYDQPQRIEVVRSWFEEAGLTQIGVRYGSNGINAKGRKPAAAARRAAG
jgi:SAM-dependent methyltransferase